MREKILQDIKQDYYQKNYSNDGQRFVAWYLRNIHNLDTVQTKDCITDGANDKQIDAVYIEDQEQIIHIIQGKFNSSNEINSEPLREVVASFNQIKDLEHLQCYSNNKLMVKINEISRALEDDYSISFELLTTSKLNKTAESDYETFKKNISENEDFNASFVVIDNETIRQKYDDALNRTNSYINYEFIIDSNKYLQFEINGIKTVLSAIPLKECINIPGIKNGRLFIKNVRQSLGKNNKVNKGIAKTIKVCPKDFFFCHNGITAICSSLEFKDGKLKVKDLNVVNGCQSLNTIFECGETAKNSDGFILFKFYEITDRDKIDSITSNTNSQSAVKAIDLRSNDKIVLCIKKTYEQAYSDGYFITKRGEEPKPPKYNQKHINSLSALGKELMAWHSQRPNLSYGETRIFDTYFNQLFHKDYLAENIQALKEMFDMVMELWIPNNPMQIDETLLAMKAYAPYHHLYTISSLTNCINNKTIVVPNPHRVYTQLNNKLILNEVVNLAGKIVNIAFKTANRNFNDSKRVFAPQNWIKSKQSVIDIDDSVRNMMSFSEFFGGVDFLKKLRESLTLNENDYSERYSAD